MTKLELIELIIIGVIALFISIYYIIKAIKNKWIGKIADTIKESIKYAEDNVPKGEKKQYVLDKVEERCAELGVPFGLIKKLISTIIDKIVANYNVIKK